MPDLFHRPRRHYGPWLWRRAQSGRVLPHGSDRLPLLGSPLLERNLRLYPWFSALAFTPCFVPVVVLFWQDNGLDLQDVFWLQGLFSLAVVLLEVPTGMVADRLGKKTSLLSAEIFLLAGLALYGLGSGFWTFLLAEVVLAVGAALFSGADSALLYDTLKALDRVSEYREREGRAKSWSLLTFAVANLIGGFVATYDLRWTWWVSMIGPALALGVAAQLQEAGVTRTGPRRDPPHQLLRDALRFVLKHRLVRWYLALFAVLNGSAVWLLWLYQPYMQLTGLPVWAFGMAFAVFNLCAALASRQAARFDHALGPRGALLGLGALQILPLVGMALVVGPFTWLLVIGQQAVRGMGRPLLSDRILAFTYADKRATVLSLAALGGRLFFAVSAPLVGFVAERLGLLGSLWFQAALLAALLGWLAWRYTRIPDKYFQVKDGVRARG